VRVLVRERERERERERRLARVATMSMERCCQWVVMTKIMTVKITTYHLTLLGRGMPSLA
jgi:hypothetical protein